MNLNLDEQTLMAFVDGELDPPTRDRVAAAVAADPELTRRVAQQRALRERVHAAYGGVVDESVPPALLAATRTVAVASPVRARRRAGTPVGWLAVAASLVVGVLLGQRLPMTEDGALVAGDTTGLVARGALARDLSNALATSDEGNVRVGLSFRSRSGEYCRTFEVAGSTLGQAGLACRAAGGDWRVQVLEVVDRPTPPAGQMRQAASQALPDSVQRAVEITIVGEPLDASSEAAARASGWAPAGPSTR